MTMEFSKDDAAQCKLSSVIQDVYAASVGKYYFNEGKSSRCCPGKKITIAWITDCSVRTDRPSHSPYNQDSAVIVISTPQQLCRATSSAAHHSRLLAFAETVGTHSSWAIAGTNIKTKYAVLDIKQ